MLKTVCKVLLTLLTAAVIAFVVSSPIPRAEAESLEDVVPKYVPVELEATEVTPIDYSKPTPYSPWKEGFLPDKAGYLDPSLSVRVESFRWFDTNIQVTWVKVADPSQLRAASYAPFPQKKDANADAIARREKAVLAINGDMVALIKLGYSVRNGQVLRQNLKGEDAKKYDVLLVDDQGMFTIIQQVNDEKIAEYQETHTVIHAFTFGPALVVNGVKNEYYPVTTCQPTHHAQRSAIGQMPDGTYVIVTTEGPEDKGSEGLTIDQMADVFMALGAENAYNLDGGCSSWLVLNYKRINGLRGSQHRPVCDIIYFVTAMPK